MFFKIRIWTTFSPFWIFLENLLLLYASIVNPRKKLPSVYYHVKALWNLLKRYFDDWLFMLDLTPQQNTIFGFHDNDDHFIISNHIFLLPKMHLQKSRSDEVLNFNYFFNFIKNFENRVQYRSNKSTKV